MKIHLVKAILDIQSLTLLTKGQLVMDFETPDFGNEDFDYQKMVSDLVPKIPWRENKRSKVLIFYHLPKCAGSSFNSALSKNFKRNVSLYSPFDWLNISSSSLTDSNLDGDIVAAGHEAWGAHELFKSRDCYYVTFLRHPFERLLSNYRYLRARSPFPLTLKEFMSNNNINELVWWLGYGSLKLAKERLNSAFDSFGIVEEMTASLAFFKDRYNLKQLDLGHINATSKKSDEEHDQEIQSLWKFLSENSQWQDLELYNYALDLFKRRTSSSKISLENIDDSSTSPEKKSDKTYFDPYCDKAKHLEELISDQSNEEAINEIEALPDENNPHRVETLARLHERNGNIEEALRYARKVRNQNLECRLMYIRLKVMKSKRPNSEIEMLLNTLKEFQNIPSICPDSSLNRALRSITAIMAEKIFECLPDSEELIPNELLRNLRNLHEQISITRENLDYWKKIINYILQSLDYHYNKTYNQLLSSRIDIKILTEMFIAL